jgi:hypothetical protein
MVGVMAVLVSKHWQISSLISGAPISPRTTPATSGNQTRQHIQLTGNNINYQGRDKTDSDWSESEEENPKQASGNEKPPSYNTYCHTVKRFIVKPVERIA